MSEPITASIIFDEPTMLSGFRWYRRMHRTSAVVRVLVLFTAGLVIAGALLNSMTKDADLSPWISLVVPAAVIGGVTFALRRFLERRFFVTGIKSSPLFDKTITYKAVGDQLEVTTPHSQGTLSWQLFSQTVETPEGLLLFQNKRVFNWLPRTAFTTSSDYAHFLGLVTANTKHSKVG